MAYFQDIEKIQYEGPDSDNNLAFRYYNPDELVEGKAMKDHLRFSAAYWHCMRANGSDPFGAPTMYMPWDDGSDSVANAQKRVPVFFEMLEKLQMPYFCFHDRDIAPEGATLKETNANLDEVVKVFKDEMAREENCLLQQIFVKDNKVSVEQHVAAVAKELGGEGYVFWGGREGYMTWLNTDMKRELEHLAIFMHMAVDYAKEIGFKGQFYFEPKPKEPTKHQYDFDSAACINFLRANGLENDVKMNIETNHATLAGHAVEHELDYAGSQGMLGSVDANNGDMLLGWDTDQFPTDVYLTTKMMLVILKYGGFTTGGLNFDAKRRRESFQPLDLFYAHIGGMDTFARGLKIAAEIRKSGELANMIKERYSSWDSGIGADIEAGKVCFSCLEKYMLEKGEIAPLSSGRQELYENVFNKYIK